MSWDWWHHAVLLNEADTAGNAVGLWNRFAQRFLKHHVIFIVLVAAWWPIKGFIRITDTHNLSNQQSNPDYNLQHTLLSNPNSFFFATKELLYSQFSETRTRCSSKGNWTDNIGMHQHHFWHTKQVEYTISFGSHRYPGFPHFMTNAFLNKGFF